MNQQYVELIPEMVSYIRGIFTPEESERLRREIDSSTEWSQMTLNVGKEGTPFPRLTSWHADFGIGYRYSGVTHPPADWTPPLLEVRERVRELLGTFRPNGVLLNLYRDGRDSIGRHADREDDLVQGAPIVGVSLGAPRLMRFRRMGRGRQETIDLELEDGSVLIMYGECQRTWTHEIRKQPEVTGQRLSLTFRTVWT